ncbi:hypothetical protein [Tsukamurella paurometabola]|uniref:Uncharacterized protein n=1 Tax=Tsukamurella paurometabola TaxID=2061 RepID=A0A3P8KQ03_TSUPA|nr:hypothetical protein [Tsukamurella paurometabola]UEA81250.1 hypothetical protein LK411_12560 [Tsukamurella paurometabola]VDR38227.1 Uncharacterised protein [Tsukamurella paurometabola]
MTGPDPRPEHRDFVPYGAPPVPRGYRGSRRARAALITAAATVVVLLVVGAALIGTFAVRSALRDARDTSSPRTVVASERIAATRTPVAPSVPQVRRNTILQKTLATPTPCALPGWSTSLAELQAFANAANGCFSRVWGTTLPPVVLFDTPDDVPPPSTSCPASTPVRGFWTCSLGTAVNYSSLVAGTGSQLASGIQWLAQAAATRVAVDAGQSHDIRALVRSVGGASSLLGTEYLRREAAQQACLVGGTLGMMVDHGITRAELDSAAAAAGLWTQLDDGAPHRLDSPLLVTWFQRGAAVRTTSPCGDAWTVPVDRLP